jgi:MFS family permease
MTFQDRLLWRLFKINRTNSDDRNAWYLVVEIFWASILGSVGAFNAAFAIRLGADNFQVSLLSSIPALLAVVVSMPAGHFLQKRARRTPWIFGSLFLYRASFLLIAAAPWIRLPGIPEGLLVVLLLVVFTAPAHFFNVGWIAMLGEIVPESRRAAVFTGRNIVNQVTVSIMVFLCGLWLSRAAFPGNYQALYLVGFVAAAISSLVLLKLHVPDSPAPAADVEKAAPIPGRRQSPLAFARETLAEIREHPAFLRITLNTLMHGFGIWMAGPLYALYFVRHLNAPDSWLGLNGTIASIGTIAGYSFWRWLMPRWGEQKSLKRMIVLAGVYPILVGFTPSLPIILAYGVINGIISPGINLAHFNTLLSVTPANARPKFTSIYMTIMNLGAFVMPMISIAISNKIGLAPMLVIAGVLSIAGSTSFWWRPVLQERAAPVTPLLEEA